MTKLGRYLTGSLQREPERPPAAAEPPEAPGESAPAEPAEADEVPASLQRSRDPVLTATLRQLRERLDAIDRSLIHLREEVATLRASYRTVSSQLLEELARLREGSARPRQGTVSSPTPEGLPPRAPEGSQRPSLAGRWRSGVRSWIRKVQARGRR